MNEELFDLDLPAEIEVDGSGRFLWTYFIDSKSNKSMLRLYQMIFALVILIPGIILFFMIYGRDIAAGYWGGAGKYLLILLAVFFGVQLLTFVIYHLVEKAMGGLTPITYAMNDEMVISHADDTSTPRYDLETRFSDVKDITLDTQADQIILHEVLRITHVYVPKNAYSFVLNYMLEHLPGSPKINQRRDSYYRMYPDLRKNNK